MAGTEETTSEDIAEDEVVATTDGDGSGGSPEECERSIDEAIANLVKSDLTQRVIVGRNWHPEGDPLEIVKQACREWLDGYVPEPQRPPDLCDECGGGERHLPDCIMMARRQR